jgi:hypothetical protein
MRPREIFNVLISRIKFMPPQESLQDIGSYIYLPKYQMGILANLDHSIRKVAVKLRITIN